MTDLIKEYSDNEIVLDIIKSDKPVLIEAGAGWCGGSHLIAPIIKKIDEEYNDKIKIIRMEYDLYKSFLNDIGVEFIPSIILVNDGKIVEIINGTISYKNLSRLVTKLLNNSNE